MATKVLSSLTRWRFGVGWYVLALLGPIGLTLAAFGLNALLDGSGPALVWQAPPSPLPGLPFPALAVFALAAIVVLRCFFQRTGGSLPAPLLLIGATGLSQMLLPLPPSDSRPFELFAGLLALVAIALVVSQRRPE